MGNGRLEQLKVVAGAEGAAYWFLGTLAIVKATGDDTGGAFTLVEQLAPAGFSPPLHVHHAEDEAYYVLEGAIHFRVGDREFDVGAGGYAFLPQAVPHTFRVEGSKPARLLIWALPAGLDRFIAEIGVRASSLTLPPPEPMPRDLAAKLAELGARYQYAILGPPLDAP